MPRSWMKSLYDDVGNVFNSTTIRFPKAAPPNSHFVYLKLQRKFACFQTLSLVYPVHAAYFILDPTGEDVPGFASGSPTGFRLIRGALPLRNDLVSNGFPIDASGQHTQPIWELTVDHPTGN